MFGGVKRLDRFQEFPKTTHFIVTDILKLVSVRYTCIKFRKKQFEHFLCEIEKKKTIRSGDANALKSVSMPVVRMCVIIHKLKVNYQVLSYWEILNRCLNKILDWCTLNTKQW